MTPFVLFVICATLIAHGIFAESSGPTIQLSDSELHAKSDFKTPTLSPISSGSASTTVSEVLFMSTEPSATDEYSSVPSISPTSSTTSFSANDTDDNPLRILPTSSPTNTPSVVANFSISNSTDDDEYFAVIPTSQPTQSPSLVADPFIGKNDTDDESLSFYPTSQPTESPSILTNFSSAHVTGNSTDDDNYSYDYPSLPANSSVGSNNSTSANETSQNPPTSLPTLSPLPFLYNATCSAYAAYNTSSATKNYGSCFFSACEGDSLRISGCGGGSWECPASPSDLRCSRDNDQFLRLAAEYGWRSGYFYAVSSSDDCKSYCHCSHLSYSVPVDGFGCRRLQVVEGCYDSSSCRGEVEIFSTARVDMLANVSVKSTKFSNFTIPKHTEQPTSQPTTFIPSKTKYTMVTVQAATAMSGVRAAALQTSAAVAAFKTAIASLLYGRVRTADIEIISIEELQSSRHTKEATEPTDPTTKASSSGDGDGSASLFYRKFHHADIETMESNSTDSVTDGSTNSTSTDGQEVGLTMSWSLSIVVERYLTASALLPMNSSALVMLLNSTLSADKFAGNLTAALKTSRPEVFENVTVKNVRVKSYAVVVVSPPSPTPTMSPSILPKYTEQPTNQPTTFIPSKTKYTMMTVQAATAMSGVRAAALQTSAAVAAFKTAIASLLYGRVRTADIEIISIEELQSSRRTQEAFPLNVLEEQNDLWLSKRTTDLPMSQYAEEEATRTDSSSQSQNLGPDESIAPASNSSSGITDGGDSGGSGGGTIDDGNVGVVVNWNVSIVVERYLAASASLPMNSSALAMLLNSTLSADKLAGNLTTILQAICPQVFENVTVQGVRVESYSVVVVSPPSAEPTISPSQAPSKSFGAGYLGEGNSAEMFALELGLGLGVGMAVLFSSAFCVYYFCVKREDSACACTSPSNLEDQGQVYYVHDIGMTREERQRQATAASVFAPTLAVTTNRHTLAVPIEGPRQDEIVWAATPAVAVAVSVSELGTRHNRRRSLTHPSSRSSSRSPPRFPTSPSPPSSSSQSRPPTTTGTGIIGAQQRVHSRTAARAPASRARPTAPIPTVLSVDLSPRRRSFSLDRRPSDFSISVGVDPDGVDEQGHLLSYAPQGSHNYSLRSNVLQARL